MSVTPSTTRLPNVAPYNTFSVTCTATSFVQGSEVAFTSTFTWGYQRGNAVGAATGFTTVQTGIVNRDLALARSNSELTVSETTAGMYTYRCQANLDLSTDNIFGRNDYYPITVTGESVASSPGPSPPTKKGLVFTVCACVKYSRFSGATSCIQRE